MLPPKTKISLTADSMLPHDYDCHSYNYDDLQFPLRR